MRHSSFHRASLLLVLIFGGVFLPLALIVVSIGLIGQGFYFRSASAVSRPHSAWSTPEPVTSSRPIRLQIESLGLDALIESVGLTPDLAMESPERADQVAWFEPGVRPGELGSAVITGHFGWDKGNPLIFNEIKTLQAGAILSVENYEGQIQRFIVRELRTYDPAADTEEIFHSADGLAHLNLITCGGEWNPVAEQYHERLVVFSDLLPHRVSLPN